jgi:hypothetical protein
MNNSTSPLESLAAFAIAFAAGVVTTAGLGAYIRHLKKSVGI